MIEKNDELMIRNREERFEQNNQIEKNDEWNKKVLQIESLKGDQTHPIDFKAIMQNLQLMYQIEL